MTESLRGTHINCNCTTEGENSPKFTNETATVVKFRICSYLPIWLDDTVDDDNQMLNNYDFRKIEFL